MNIFGDSLQVISYEKQSTDSNIFPALTSQPMLLGAAAIKQYLGLPAQADESLPQYCTSPQGILLNDASLEWVAPQTDEPALLFDMGLLQANEIPKFNHKTFVFLHNSSLLKLTEYENKEKIIPIISM